MAWNQIQGEKENFLSKTCNVGLNKFFVTFIALSLSFSLFALYFYLSLSLSFSLFALILSLRSLSQSLSLSLYLFLSYQISSYWLLHPLNVNFLSFYPSLSPLSFFFTPIYIFLILSLSPSSLFLHPALLL